MTHEDELAAALSAAGIPGNAVVLVGPPEPDAPPPPEGPWILLPWEGRYMLGGFSRGAFRPYSSYATFAEARDLAVRLASEPAASRPAPEDVAEAGRRTAEAVRARTRSNGGQAGPAGVGAGDLLDLVGPETGHHLYALGTPFPERSQPPTDVGREYHRYEVLAPLPEAQEGLAAPWFEQPGGGAMVVLGRPVRWYVDRGLLVELAEPASTHSSTTSRAW